jgi:uncharacterized protein YoxC
VELRKAIASLRNATEKNLNPALEELQLTLKSIRSVYDDVSGITADMKEVVDSITEVSTKIHAVNRFMDMLGSSATVKASSLKAGLVAALSYLATNLLKKGERQ